MKITEETAFTELLAMPALREELISLMTRAIPEEAKKLEETGEPAPMAASIPLRAIKSLSRGAIPQEDLNELIARCNRILGMEEA